MNECLYCKKSFKKIRPWQQFCSPKCRYKDWNDKHIRVLKTQIPHKNLPEIT